MTINFFLNWNEYHTAQKFFRRSRQGMAAEKVLGGLLMVASALWFCLNDLNLGAVAGLAAGLLVIFIPPVFRRWELKRKWEREPLYHTEHTVSFSEEGVHFLMGQIESKLDWGYYQRLVETPEGFLLVYGNEAFNYFPKRTFGNEQMINEFRALAQKKLKKNFTDNRQPTNDSERTTRIPD
jgi:hypothetical protein